VAFRLREFDLRHSPLSIALSLKFGQSWPTLELTSMDHADRRILRRILGRCFNLVPGIGSRNWTYAARNPWLNGSAESSDTRLANRSLSGGDVAGCSNSGTAGRPQLTSLFHRRSGRRFWQRVSPTRPSACSSRHSRRNVLRVSFLMARVLARSLHSSPSGSCSLSMGSRTIPGPREPQNMADAGDKMSRLSEKLETASGQNERRI